MKKNLLMVFTLLLFSCQKDVKKNSEPITPKLPAPKFTQQSITHSLAANVDGNGVETDVTYLGSGNYHLHVRVPSSLLRPNSGYTFMIYGANSSSSNALLPYNDQTRILDVTYPFKPGSYFIYYSDNVNFSGNGTTFTIAAKPTTLTTTGYVPIYRFFNPDLNRHLYTNNWEELGGYSDGYSFEGIQGYLYDNAGRATNLVPLYRYYNSTSQDYYLSKSSTPPGGYTTVGIIGYISTTSSGSTDAVLNEYFATSTGHLYVCPPETAASPYVYDASPGYIIPANPDVLPGGIIPLFRYNNATTGQHFYTNKWSELGYKYIGFVFEKIQGYMYDNASRTTNLKPIYRYYNSTTGSHYVTDVLGTFPGFTYERILGYVSTVSTATMSKQVTKWYNSQHDDHFLCVPPEVGSSGYTQDATFTLGYVQ